MEKSYKKYINGNYIVTLSEDGSKEYRALRVEEEFHPNFPDSIDLKITNQCQVGCKWCHENSTPQGRHMSLRDTLKIFNQISQYPIELAIGGGDVLKYPYLIEFLTWIKESTQLQPRLTINIESMKYHDGETFRSILSLISGIGLSIDNISMPSLEIPRPLTQSFQGVPVVLHIIAGLLSPTKLKLLLFNYNVLILGYKSVGRGKLIQSPLTEDWISEIKALIYEMRGESKDLFYRLSFDNLALEQLNIRSSVLDEEWDSFYMGDDFSHSMYVDAVEGEFAPTSRSSKAERVSWDDIELVKYFKQNRNSHEKVSSKSGLQE